MADYNGPTTEFQVALMPKDGPIRHLTAEMKAVVSPTPGDTVGVDLDWGIHFEVRAVTYYPTCDPSVYVECSSLFPETDADAELIVKRMLDKGWKLVGG